MATALEGAETLRWYTSALRIPRLIGKLTSGERIWGGPYTITQACVGAVLLVVGVKTMSWWGPLNLVGDGVIGFLGNWALVGGIAFAGVKLSGQLPAARVNARLALTGGARQLKASSAGTWRGQAPVTGRRTHRKGRIVVTDLADRVITPTPQAIQVPRPVTHSAAAGEVRPAAQPPAPAAQTRSPDAAPETATASSTPDIVDKLAALVGHH